MDLMDLRNKSKALNNDDPPINKITVWGPFWFSMLSLLPTQNHNTVRCLDKQQKNASRNTRNILKRFIIYFSKE